MRIPLRRSEGELSSNTANLLLYQAGWWACVLGGASGRGDLGAAVAASLVLLHLGLASERRVELGMVGVSLTLGLVFEPLLVASGAIHYAGEAGGPANWPTAWIGALWLQFGTLFRYGLWWLAGRPVLGLLLGAVGGPLTFVAGERLGAVTLGEPRSLALVLLALVWAVALPLLAATAARSGSAGRYRASPARASR